MTEAERLRQAPESVVEMQSERQVCDQVEAHYDGVLEADDQVGVGITRNEIRVHGPDGQMQEVIDDVQQNDDSTPPHGTGRIAEGK